MRSHHAVTRCSRLAFASFAALAIALLVGAPLALAGDLVVRVHGHAPDGGSIRVAAYASGSDFEADRRLVAVTAEPAEGTVEVILPDVPDGAVGIAAYQDNDGNEQLSKNFVGIPKEPFGFSNGARGRFGPPEFEAIQIVLDSAGAVIEVDLE